MFTLYAERPTIDCNTQVMSKLKKLTERMKQVRLGRHRHQPSNRTTATPVLVTTSMKAIDANTHSINPRREPQPTTTSSINHNQQTHTQHQHQQKSQPDVATQQLQPQQSITHSINHSHRAHDNTNLAPQRNERTHLAPTTLPNARTEHNGNKRKERSH